ncbi:conserved hypothetical protein [Methylobacterium sp. 4-46]|uniref:hypothetical protein n=1 Tax=unclassified Methylobacterium TaxID=2615210 RepID=UPI000165C64A|nr:MULTISPECIES: hypothetical protein [Methylobacterium]ACA17400.1 conserved hypothetical protein [Methylobacterium sp. 4-46]WFT83086.1 hypothetical protein QA634_15165 [Methylobacterium nodulans]
MRNWLTGGWPSAGIFAGPTAWLVSTQANYALAPWSCAHRFPVIPLLAAALVAASLGGSYASWRACQRPPEADATTVPAPDGSRATSLDSPEGGRPHRLIAAIGVLVSLLFAVVIGVHGVAGLVFSGCER